MSIIRCLAASTLATASALAGAQASRSSIESMPVPQLQRIYLECDRAASHALLDTGTAAFCSTVAEELRERGFGGSFSRLLAWWQQARRFDEPGDRAGARERISPAR